MLSSLESLVHNSDCDAVSVAVLDFEESHYNILEYRAPEIDQDSPIYYDLASLSKPLNNSVAIFSENIVDEELLLLANHCAGIPSWGLLSNKSWKKDLLKYRIKDSKTLYSDYSALRFMLDFEMKTKKSLKLIRESELDSEVVYWTELEDELTLQNGYINGEKNFSSVHDPNAYNLRKDYVNHAGLFGTICGVARSLLNLNDKYKICDRFIKESTESRFWKGFDTVQNPDNTLAGTGCSAHTFGHLGFTGTSMWIDAEKKKGHIILTNTTKYQWFNKKELNKFRKEIGKEIWNKER